MRIGFISMVELVLGESTHEEAHRICNVIWKSACVPQRHECYVCTGFRLHWTRLHDELGHFDRISVLKCTCSNHFLLEPIPRSLHGGNESDERQVALMQLSQGALM